MDLETIERRRKDIEGLPGQYYGLCENYRRFATAAEAIRYAVETRRTRGAWLDVGDERFNSSEIERLYEAEDYPLRKAD